MARERTQTERVLGRGVVPGHTVRWFVYTGGTNPDGTAERIPRTSSMRGSWPGYEAECSCGWKSRTGGGVESWVRELVSEHKIDVEFGRPS
jgi:hypothetical protein